MNGKPGFVDELAHGGRLSWTNPLPHDGLVVFGGIPMGCDDRTILLTVFDWKDYFLRHQRYALPAL